MRFVTIVIHCKRFSFERTDADVRFVKHRQRIVDNAPCEADTGDTCPFLPPLSHADNIKICLGRRERDEFIKTLFNRNAPLCLFRTRYHGLKEIRFRLGERYVCRRNAGCPCGSDECGGNRRSIDDLAVGIDAERESHLRILPELETVRTFDKTYNFHAARRDINAGKRKCYIPRRREGGAKTFAENRRHS
jgi:hypothetical protein